MIEIFSVKNTVNPARIKKTSLTPLHFIGNNTRSDMVSFQATKTQEATRELKCLLDNYHTTKIDDGSPGRKYILHLNIKQIEKLLNEGANINVKNYAGNSLLHIATRYNDLKLTRFALKHKANVNLKDKTDNTALHLAMHTGNYKLIKLLVDNDAKVMVRNNYKETPLHLIYDSNLKIVKLLTSKKADANALDNNGNSPLHNIAARTNEDFITVNNDVCAIIEHLIQKGADVNKPNNYGETPLLIAAKNGTLESAKVLVKHKAKVNVEDNNGLTPIYWTNTKKDMEFTQFLQECAKNDPLI